MPQTGIKPAVCVSVLAELSLDWLTRAGHEGVETILYFVRHAESVFAEGQERTRGLSDQGLKDALKVRDLLRTDAVDLFVSSPYERSIATIRPAAAQRQKEIGVEEDLRERAIGGFAPETFKEAKRRVFADIHFAYPQGESSLAAQKRAVNAICTIIQANQGRRIVIGTHGDIMTLMLNHFDQRYGFGFWEAATMPDIYKLRLEEMALIEVQRMWGNLNGTA